MKRLFKICLYACIGMCAVAAGYSIARNMKQWGIPKKRTPADDLSRFEDDLGEDDD